VSPSKGSKGSGSSRPPTPEAEPERSALIPDLFRRAFALGLSGIFTTEEAFRRALGDTLPKDWVDFAVDQSERTRTEFVNRLAGEMARVIESMDLDEMLRRVLREHRIEVKADFRLVPEKERRGGRSRSSVDTTVVRGGKRK
jgi:hypothetical protein